MFFGDLNVKTSDISHYTTDWLKMYNEGKVVCIPENTEQISKLLKYCNERKIGVVPQGGNTGLVGGGVPMHFPGKSNDSEIILSLSKLNQIIELDTSGSVLVCEAGCIVQQLESYLSENNYLLPLDLASKGSCMIGGTVATNAGGVRVLRYGSMHHNVLGLEVVLASGEIVNLLKTLRKDNTGYDLKHYFIGSEGTLGVITKVAIQVVAKPTSTNTLLVELKSFQELPALLSLARSNLGELLSAFEYLDDRCVHALKEVYPEMWSRVGTSSADNNSKDKIFVLIESSGYARETDMIRLENFASTLLENNKVYGVLNAVLSQNESQWKNMWAIRENVPVALAQLSRIKSSSSTSSSPSDLVLNKLFKFDISLSHEHMIHVVHRTAAELRYLGYKVLFQPMDGDRDSSAGDENIPSTEKFNFREQLTLDIHNFGHMGDNNLHLNVLLRPTKLRISRTAGATADEYIQLIQNDLDHIIYSLVVSCHGSISAEHGIGQLKVNKLAMARSRAELDLMRAIKNAFDPNNILNPGKVIPRA